MGLLVTLGKTKIYRRKEVKSNLCGLSVNVFFFTIFVNTRFWLNEKLWRSYNNTRDFYSTYYAPGTVENALNALTHLILITAL